MCSGWARPGCSRGEANLKRHCLYLSAASRYYTGENGPPDRNGFQKGGLRPA